MITRAAQSGAPVEGLLESLRKSNETFRQKALLNGRTAKEDAYKTGASISRPDPRDYGYRKDDNVTVYTGVGKSFSFSWKDPSYKIMRYQARIAMLNGYIDRASAQEDLSPEEREGKICNARREIRMLRRAIASEEATRKRNVVIVLN